VSRRNGLRAVHGSWFGASPVPESRFHAAAILLAVVAIAISVARWQHSERCRSLALHLTLDRVDQSRSAGRRRLVLRLSLWSRAGSMRVQSVKSTCTCVVLESCEVPALLEPGRPLELTVTVDLDELESWVEPALLVLGADGTSSLAALPLPAHAAR
jgi:hypothetical protein